MNAQFQRKLIVAANYREAGERARRDGLSLREWKYVTSPADVLGYRDPEVIWVDGWYEHPQAGAIEAALKTRMTGKQDPAKGTDAK